MSPGFEFAGRVEARGAGAGGPFKPGERVFGLTRFGGYAERIAADETWLWPCPDDWDDAECAAFPTVYFTAAYGLFEVAKVSAGETLLIHSAAGGVGTALLQLARIAGCRPFAVVGSPHKAELALRLGAEAVIDRSSRDLWAEADRLAPGGFDAVLDSGGLATLRPGFERLAPGGRLVVYGFAEVLPRASRSGRPGLLRLAWNRLRIPSFSPFELTATNRSVQGFNLVYLTDRPELGARAMGELLGWVREGRIRKVPVARFPAARAADAHRELESGRTVGKLVLTFD